MYIVEKNFGSKCEAKQKAYEQSVAYYTSETEVVCSARLWVHRNKRSAEKILHTLPDEKIRI